MSDDEPARCGVSRIWATPADDFFAEACKLHDDAYIQGSIEQQTMTRKEVDRELLHNMLVAARSSWALKVRAYLFYGLTRCLGGKLWEGKR